MAKRQINKPKKKSKYYYQYRSSVTGQFVTKKYADKYPGLTIRQRSLRYK